MSQIDVWVEVEKRRLRDQRKVMVIDTAGSINGVFSKKGLTPYLQLIDQD